MAACPPATIRVMLRVSGNKRLILASFSSQQKEEMYEFIRETQRRLRETNEPGHVYQSQRRKHK